MFKKPKFQKKREKKSDSHETINFAHKLRSVNTIVWYLRNYLSKQFGEGNENAELPKVMLDLFYQAAAFTDEDDNQEIDVEEIRELLEQHENNFIDIFDVISLLISPW